MSRSMVVDALLIVGAICFACFVVIASARLAAGVSGDLVIAIPLFAGAWALQAWSFLQLPGEGPEPPRGPRTSGEAGASEGSP